MPKPQALLVPCLAWALCLPRQWPEAPSPAGRPEPPPGSVTPADAPTPQDCGLSRIQNRVWAQMFPFSGSGAASWNNHGDSLPEFTFEWREEDFFSPGASGTWYLPWEPVQDANPGPCLCVCLLSQGGCREADELRRGSVYGLHALSGIFWLLVSGKWSG